ncbi:Longitudinals lacking protein, isoforms A/B/D/L [Ooceraea biroi]|uniref:Longitudinals lacking protein, isoforms A/B/D/L n=1 Tax=Ooceraea biroi TaxID=2015173 RepID=A0A026W594_OOCBI|nr:Longitudinals lacking protein, isoforms A/B/D/L [Ooceraea biroi]
MPKFLREVDLAELTERRLRPQEHILSSSLSKVPPQLQAPQSHDTSLQIRMRHTAAIRMSILQAPFAATNARNRPNKKGETVYPCSVESTVNRRYGMFECPSCHNLYKWKKSMLAHLRYQCKQPPRFECFHCPIKNYQKAHIIRHLRVHHPDHIPMFFDRKLNTLCRPR